MWFFSFQGYMRHVLCATLDPLGLTSSRILATFSSLASLAVMHSAWTWGAAIVANLSRTQGASHLSSPGLPGAAEV